MMNDTFQFGVNYWPRRQAMRFWSEFDAAVVDEDFALLEELGLTTVRLFLLWEDFQPAVDEISGLALTNLERVLELAADHGLSLNVTFFTGHMSGPNWIPSWLLEGPPSERVSQVVSRGRIVQSGYKNPFSDPAAIQAGRLLIRRVVERCRSHPAVGVWNLGNEPDLVAHPPSDAAGRDWVRGMVDTIRAAGGEQPVTMGLHAVSLTQNVGLRVDQICAELDFASMHAYPMYIDWATGPLDPHLVPFCCALTRALSGKPTLMEEFGGCTNTPGQTSQTWKFQAFGKPREQYMSSEEDFAAHLEKVLPELVEVGATGALLWCFSDYPTEIWHLPPCDQVIHERFFGLTRGDGSLKPHARVLSRFASDKPRIQQPRRAVTLDVSPDEYYRDPGHHSRRLYRSYLQAQGFEP